MTHPGSAPSPVDPALRARLEEAAAGLLYSSEGDHPFEFFSLPWSEDEPVTLPAFASRVGAAPDETTKEITLERFLVQHIENTDPYDAVAQEVRPRYERLRETLRRSLPDLHVFRIGEVEIRCYAVGRDGHGNVAGLTTVAIET